MVIVLEFTFTIHALLPLFGLFMLIVFLFLSMSIHFIFVASPVLAAVIKGHQIVTLQYIE
jgi:hypothetical protein